MSHAESNNTDLPDDEHLRKDVSSPSEVEAESSQEEDFTPGLTNAGQQVGGLASGTGYKDKQDPHEPGTNNPV